MAVCVLALISVTVPKDLVEGSVPNKLIAVVSEIL